MYHLLFACILCTLSAPLSSMGKSKTESSDDAPHHIELGPDQGIYEALVIDGTQQTEVTKISFAGDTTLDGVKKEHDNSFNRLSFADITEMKILNPIHESDRYKGQDLSEVAVRTTTGAVEKLLLPRHLMICAQSKQSNIKKSWFIRSLQGIVIKHGIREPITAVTAHHAA